MPTGLYAPRAALARLAISLVLTGTVGAAGCDPVPTRVPTVPASAPLTGAPPTPEPSPTEAASTSATPPDTGASPGPSPAAPALSGYAWDDQLDDPWLDESLTQYATWQYIADTHGPEAAAGFRASLEGRRSGVDFAEIPIGLPVASYEGQAYSAIVYGRGPLFFDALAVTLGRAAFDAFLTDYAQTYRWGIATPEGLRQVAEEHCACDLGGLFAEWVEK